MSVRETQERRKPPSREHACRTALLSSLVAPTGRVFLFSARVGRALYRRIARRHLIDGIFRVGRGSRTLGRYAADDPARSGRRPVRKAYKEIFISFLPPSPPPA